MIGREHLFAITVRRVRVVPVDDGPVTPAAKAVFLAELARLGFRVRHPERYTDAVLADHEQLVGVLEALRGGHVEHVPLFDGFPERAPDPDAYLVRRVVGYLGHTLGTFEEGPRLEDGLVVPAWLFDLTQFGADPIAQMQDQDLFQAALRRQRQRDHDPRRSWTDLELVSPSEAEARTRRFLHAALTARSSIKEALRPDLEALLDHFGLEGLDLAAVTFKETRTLVMRYLWQRGREAEAVALADTPTDLLRLFAALTGTDVSLADPVRYPRLTRPQRRLVLARLAAAADLRGDLRRYPRLWKAIGKGLHPGEHARRFPHVAAAFTDLRRGRIRTWNGRVEVALADRRIDDAVALLSQRPGIFARRLHHVARVASDPATVTEAFATVASDLPVKLLLVLEKHLRTVDEHPRRPVINKRGTVRVLSRPEPPLPPPVRERLVDTCRAALRTILARRAPWSSHTVWLDPALANLTVPLQQRRMADGLLTVGRGSKLPLAPGPVVRLFVWWQQVHRRTDLDLAATTYDASMRYLGHVSWTRLRGAGMAHSGDLQSAPYGAAEFLDVDLAAVAAQLPDARYVAPTVHRYCGDAFAEMSAFTGWMIREGVDARYRTFDIAAVQNKLLLGGEGSYAVPYLIDLKRREVTVVDLCVHGLRDHSTAEDADRDISTITRELARLAERRPTVAELVRLHLAARGADEVASRDEATRVAGVGEGDIDALHLEGVLADLL